MYLCLYQDDHRPHTVQGYPPSQIEYPLPGTTPIPPGSHHYPREKSARRQAERKALGKEQAFR